MEKLFRLFVTFLILFVPVLTAHDTMAQGKPIKLALILGTGGRGDLGWNDLGWRGAELAKEKGYVKDYSLLVATTPSETLSMVTNLASSGENDLILSVGWASVAAIKEAANRFPNQNYAQMDTRPDLKEGDPGNGSVLGLVFRQEQMSALAGALAAFTAVHYDFPHVGVVLGREGAILHDFEVGYKWGVDWGIQWLQKNKASLLANKKFLATPKTKRVLWTYTGTFNDPAKGKAATVVQLDQGACVVYQVAGGTGLGVLAAVADYHKDKGIGPTSPPFGIGVDADQDWINPYILASGMKRVDTAALEACRLAYEGKFREAVKNYKGTLVMSLANGGVALSNEQILEEFLDFGLKTGGITKEKVPQVINDYKKLRAAQPAWFWDAIKELENLIKAGKVEIPKPTEDPVKYDIRKLREIYG